MNAPCITNDDEFIYIADVSGNSFGFVDIATGDAFTGPDIPTTRTNIGSCVINDHYLYVVGGGSSDINRMDLDRYHNANGNNSNNTWQTLDVKFDTSNGASIDYSSYSHTMIQSIGDYIYLIAGGITSGNDGINDVNYLNTKTMTVAFASYFPYYVYHTASMYVMFDSAA